ncbi:hypothetical protein [Pseudocnuella soli]|uniref:hypothetical protein n=1 Tax=Pseudocnuella soli TaxID=2502779 RepID=UPI00104BEA4D|nr:hypothetical protein [Pseudocnuella soli]
MKRLFIYLSAFLIVLSSFVSCSRESVGLNTPSGKSLLVAHTWHLAEVTELVSGKAIKVYRKGAARNADDYSLVRHTFKRDGSLQYVDQFGNSGTDGEYYLNAADSQLQMALGAQNLVAEAVNISTDRFEYTVQLSEEDAIRYTFSPEL